MSEPIISDNSNNIVTDLQGQSQSSGFITVYEIEIPDSNIGGAGTDRLYYHDGANGTADITWYTPKDNVANFGSTNSSDYMSATYTAFPVESDGWEVRGTGSLPRPTIRFANINQYWNAYLTDYDDLVGAKVIRRRTLEKYLSSNPPIEFNRDVYYIERKVTENKTRVEFELSSAFDVQGIKLPRRTVVAARCPWKYKDPSQGGCDWPVDNRFTIDSTEYALYFDKDDTQITKASDLDSPGTNEWTYWGRQDVEANRQANLYEGDITYAVGDYVEYERPIGSMYSVTMTSGSSNEATITFTSSALASEFDPDTAGEDYMVLKGFDDEDANFKNVPLKVTAQSGSTVTVEHDNSYTSGTSVSGFAQATRRTLYRCKVSYTLNTADSLDDIVRPTNISYWEFGDVCGKRLESCSIRYGHNPVTGTALLALGPKVTGSVNNGKGSGYSAVPTVSIGAPDAGLATDVQATAEAVLGTGAQAGQVIRYNITERGFGYTTAPTVTVSGNAEAIAVIYGQNQSTRNVPLPFGGFPGASLY